MRGCSGEYEGRVFVLILDVKNETVKATWETQAQPQSESVSGLIVRPEDVSLSLTCQIICCFYQSLSLYTDTIDNDAFTCQSLIRLRGMVGTIGVVYL